MDRSHTTTAFTIDGYRITKTFGIVRGITVRSRSIFGTIGGALQTLAGGNITLFTELCEKTRGDAFDMMIAHAAERRSERRRRRSLRRDRSHGWSH